MKVPIGFVAVQPKGALPIKLHLVREDQTGTLCGRYGLDRILPENEELPDTTRKCRVCLPKPHPGVV